MPQFAFSSPERFVRKTADETVNNSTTLQNDDALTFPIGASEEWGFMLYAQHTSGTTPDIKYGMSVPSGATVRGFRTSFNGGGVADTVPNADLTSAFAGFGNAATPSGIVLIGLVKNSTTAGNVTLQWAQNGLEESDTKVLSGSWLRAWRVK